MLPAAARPLFDQLDLLAPWLIVLFGLGVLYVPSFVDLSRGIWVTEEQAHGPIVFAVFLWLLWRKRDALLAPREVSLRARAGGVAVLAAGLLLYVLGRSQGIPTFEIGSLIWVLAGTILLLRGGSALLAVWFPLFFACFMTPMPAIVVDTLTAPMKMAVSAVSEQLMYALGYPVARSGVMLHIGQYQLLVADACAGLYTLFTLEALGLLYLNLVRHDAMWRNLLLAALIVPISFASNVIRVTTLALITFYLGDEAGQGFLHGFAGLLLFATALVLIFVVDGLIELTVRRSRGKGRNVDPVPPASADVSAPARLLGAGRLYVRSAVAVAASMFVGAAAASLLSPGIPAAPRLPGLDMVVPARLSEWRMVASPLQPANLVATNAHEPATRNTVATLYDEVLTRTYAGESGEQIMLAIAYARQQRQDVKIHKPETCYAAQGYEVGQAAEVGLPVLEGGGAIPGVEFAGRDRDRYEAVTYWIRIGEAYPHTALRMREHILREGLAGRIPDGVLVRVSSIVDDPAKLGSAYATQRRFMADLLKAVPAATRAVLAGDMANLMEETAALASGGVSRGRHQ
ncbi:MAG: exosortase B [Moraxellaceae bacterium]|nr:exosortase B [Moraxellaceae bacterium]